MRKIERILVEAYAYTIAVLNNTGLIERFHVFLKIKNGYIVVSCLSTSYFNPLFYHGIIFYEKGDSL